MEILLGGCLNVCTSGKKTKSPVRSIKIEMLYSNLDILVIWTKCSLASIASKEWSRLG